MSVHSDDRLPPFAEILVAATNAMVADDGFPWTVETLRVETPWELELESGGERLEIGAAPPTQIVETSVMPVWHRLAVTVRIDDGRLGG